MFNEIIRLSFKQKPVMILRAARGELGAGHVLNQWLTDFSGPQNSVMRYADFHLFLDLLNQDCLRRSLWVVFFFWLFLFLVCNVSVHVYMFTYVLAHVYTVYMKASS